MFEYRVTKYDPRHRNESGHYLRKEWTSFDDIGKNIGGHLLTAAEYAKVEDAYVAVALAFMQESGKDTLGIAYLENCHGYQEPGLPLAVDAALHRNQIEQICRLCLRGVVWCKLEGLEGRFVHFGWDYYMYIGVPSSCPNAQALAHSLGLFVEPCESPYHDAG